VVRQFTAIAFDWGHTVMDERRDEHIPLEARPVHLMPGVADVLPQLRLPLFLWANTRVADGAAVQQWLERAGLSQLFRCVVTSVDAGSRKPSAQFFDYSVRHCGVTKDAVLFVGNQLNTDVAGAQAFGISTVWLSGPAFRSVDDGPCDATPTYTIETLYELPGLVHQLQNTRVS
jgi:FMN phosphatase YigB (HAD superfamily)